MSLLVGKPTKSARGQILFTLTVCIFDYLVTELCLNKQQFLHLPWSASGSFIRCNDAPGHNLPSRQGIGKTPPSSKAVHQATDGVGLTSANDAWRWGRGRRRTQRMCDRRLDPGHVECGAESPRRREESQADGCRTDHVGHRERTHVTGRKFFSTSSDGDVLCGEPHALSNPIGGSRSPPPVGLLLHPGRCSHHGGACGPPRAPAPPDERFRRRDPHLLLLNGKQWGLVPETAFKR